jgi:hypothetical protein
VALGSASASPSAQRLAEHERLAQRAERDASASASPNSLARRERRARRDSGACRCLAQARGPIMTITIPILQNHARDLALAFDIRLITDPRIKPDEALAIPRRRIVLASDIIDDTTYAVILHEMGHLVAALGSLRTAATIGNANLLLDEEDAAWAWAEHYALEWTPAMQAVKTYARGTYDRARHPTQPTTAPALPPAPRKTIDWSKYK